MSSNQSIILKLIGFISRNYKISLCLILLLPVMVELPMLTFPQHLMKPVNKGGTAKFLYPIDTQLYAKYVEYFRGNEVQFAVKCPFAYRPLTPFIASFLPLSAINALNFTNLIFVYLILFVLFHIIKSLNLDKEMGIVAGLLFVISYPIFQFSPIGLVDVSALFFVCLGIWSLLNEKIVFLFLSIIIGLLAKETVIVILPFAVAYWFNNFGMKRITFLLSTCLIAVYFVELFAIRNFFNFSGYYYWNFETFAVIDNLTRRGTLISAAITFGLPGILSLIFIKEYYDKLKKEYSKYIPFVFGIIAGFGLYCYAIVSAFADGRFIWYIYPFAIPLAVIYIQNKKNPQTL